MSALPARLIEEDVPDAPGIHARAGGENFRVAAHLVPRGLSRDLRALYGYARLVDELGDSGAGDRLARLDWLEAELERAYAGEARHPLLRALEPVIAAHRLPRDPFLRLIEANRVDQRRHRYPTYEDLLGYCHLSANPVGELVLHVLGAASAERVRLSNAVCSALQLLEHWQDVREDALAGRIYVPQEDLARFGLPEDALAAPTATPAGRALMAFETMRARALLDEGAPLVGRLPLPGRVAVAGYVGGGRANLAALVAAGHDVWGRRPRAGKAARAAAVLHAFVRGGAP